MKKKSAVLIIIAVLVSLLAGCGSSNGSTKNNNTSKDNSFQKIKDAGTLKIGLDDSYPPMEFRDEKNELAGFDIDMGKELAKKLGVKYEPVTTDFNGIVLALKSGKFDAIIAAMSITDERKKEIDFVGPYIDGGQIIVVKNGSPIQGKADLKGKILAAQLGSTGEQAANKIEGTKEVKKYDKVTEAFHDLSIGRADALIVDGQVGGYYTKKEAGTYKILTEKLTKEPEGIGVKKENKELKDALDKALDELKKDGTLSKLSMKWFGYDIYKQS